MSYNTRNTRQNQQGAGRGTAQIMYHQQPQSRPPVSSSMQNNSGQYSQPARNLQPTRNSQPAAQNQYGSQPAPTAYVTQQKLPAQPPIKVYEYQKQQLPPVQSQALPAVTVPAQQPVKVEAVSSVKEDDNGDVDEDIAMDGADADITDTVGAAETGKRSWMKKKVPGYKVDKKFKRRRQNARLRKMLQPKNAIMVLNELKAGVKFTVSEQTTSFAPNSFVVNAEVDGKIHVGQGPSKPLAKQNAAENVLKALLLEKMAMAAASKTPDGTEAMDQDGTEVAANGSGETSEDVKPEDETNNHEDEVPWGSLASFALFKLFTDWQNQGTHVPIAKQTPPPQAQPVKTAAQKQLPENPTERHPVMLLSQMRPGVKFTEKCRDGTAPNLTFTLEVSVDGVTYEGVAKNKKEAKKEAAKAALNGCFGIQYDVAV